MGVKRDKERGCGTRGFQHRNIETQKKRKKEKEMGEGGVYEARWLKAVFLRLLTRCSELVTFAHSSFFLVPPSGFSHTEVLGIYSMATYVVHLGVAGKVS